MLQEEGDVVSSFLSGDVPTFLYDLREPSFITIYIEEIPLRQVRATVAW